MMKPMFLAACAILACAGLSDADVISGRVVDRSSQPVAGVRVLLGGLNVSATTGADGLFSLTTPTSTLAPARSGEAGFEFRGEWLRLESAKPQQVSLEVYAVDGRRLATLFRGLLGRGPQELSLAGWRRGLAPGHYLLALRRENQWSYAKLHTDPGSRPVPLARRSAPLAAPDSLVLTKSAWFRKTVPLAEVNTRNLGDVTLRKDPIVVGNVSQDQYNAIIVDAVDKRLDSLLYMIIKAMIVIESSFNAKAISMYDVQLPCGTHSYGLIQVTPGCVRGYATLPAGTPVTATISGGLSGDPAKLTYANPADQAAGNTVVMENNIVINLVSNPSNPHWPTSGFNPAYNLDYGAKTLAELRAAMRNKFKGCSEADYVAMALAGYNQGSGTVTGCTGFSPGGVTYSTNVLNQYRKFCQAAGITPVF